MMRMKITMTSSLPFPRTAKPCHLKALPTPLTPVFSTLARPTLNQRTFNILPTIGGRVPLVIPTCPEPSRRVPITSQTPVLFSWLPSDDSTFNFELSTLLTRHSPQPRWPLGTVRCTFRRRNEVNPLNKNLAKAAAVGALGGFLFGFDTAVISGTTQALTGVYHLSPEQLGLTVSMALIGT